MSDIKAGDLVMVVRPTPCCGNTMRVGMVAIVQKVKRIEGGRCRHCLSPGDPRVWRATWPGVPAVSVDRLIRIDPPAQPESVETDREVTA